MTNEFKIISEDGLKTLCKAIKKVSTVGEILDDANSVTDKTYSSFEIDRRLNTKIDKTQLTTVLDDSVTDEQVASAKAVYDGLENIDDFNVQVVKENLDLNNIIETGIYFFPQAYTPVNIPVGANGWLLVMKGNDSRFAKQVWYRQGTANLNNHDTFERYKAGDTWSEWTKFLTEKDYYSALNSGNTTIPQNADLNDYVTPGVYTCLGGNASKTLVNCPHTDSNFKLIVNKNIGNDTTFYGYQMIVGTVGSNPVTDVCIYYRGITTNSNVYAFSKWKIMSGTTVADVPLTKLTVNSWASGSIYYTVKNGICFVQVDSLMSATMNTPSQIILSGLPKPMHDAWHIITANTVAHGSMLVRVTGENLINHIGIDNGLYFGSFSYPVAE